MPKIKELSVFFPAYNEAENIENTVKKARDVLEKVAEKWEMIIVDDGSSDRTSQIADDLALKDTRIRAIHQPNRGYGGALKTGFENAKYEWVAFTDSDGQFDFGEITKFIAKKNDADLILGFRKNRADSFLRKAFTFGWSALARILLGLTAKDYSCGFKMIKKEVCEAVLPLVGEEKVTQIEMLVKAKRLGFSFAEVGVNHYPRAGGKQTGANLKVVFKSIFGLFKLWFALTDKLTLIILSAILLIGAFLRLYRIGEYMTFLGDEGRDVIIVRRLLVEAHPPLIGAVTSIGNMYLGPLYYYMMAPALLIANFSPVGPAIMVALLGVATIFLVWKIAKEWFPSTGSGQVEWGALMAAFLYAIAPTVIIHSRSSWNPNIMPFFSLLSIYAIWKVYESREASREVGWWLIILGISYAFVLQSHYLGLLLAPVLFLFWILTFRNLRLIGKWKSETGKFLRNSLIGLVIFAGLMSPLLIFDLRHNFQNFNSIMKFSVESGGSFAGPVTGVKNFVPVFVKTNTRLVAGRNETVGKWFSLGFTVLFIYVVTTSLRSGVVRLEGNWFKSMLLVISWFLVGIFGLALYKGEIFDHYMGFIFPAPFFLVGVLVQELLTIKYRLSKIALFIALGLLVIVNFVDNPLRYPPNRQLQSSMEIANFINEKAMGERLNLASLTERNNRDVYQYFLLVWGAKVVDTDPNAVFYTVTDQLFVVCAKPEKDCDPVHDPSAWITNFGWSKIEDHWQVAGVNIYKLAHAK